MTAPLCVGCSGQCLYRSVVGCCHKKVSTATWQLFNFNEQSGRNLQIHLIRRIVKLLQTIANQSSESKCQKHGYTNELQKQTFSGICSRHMFRSIVSKANLHRHGAPTHHDVPPYVHGPVPRGPPNPKSPNPLSQPPRNPKGVLAPTHHDVPPYVHGPLLRSPPNPKSPNPLSQKL